jgi:hypothetical protein
MNEIDRENEILKSQATFFNALGIGAIIAGGVSAIGQGNIGAFLTFLLVGVILHALALSMLRKIIVED